MIDCENNVTLMTPDSNIEINLISKGSIFVDVTIKGKTNFFIYDKKKNRFKNLLGDKNEK